MGTTIRIGTRESQLAFWQAMQVRGLLAKYGVASEFVFIKSEGDIDIKTPLYEIGIQGIFTKSLDNALLSNKIDVAVHSMKDVPTNLAAGIAQAAILKRGSFKDLLVYKNNIAFFDDPHCKAIVATSSVRRKAQWLHRYPNHTIENLRGNVNTRLKKIADSHWDGALFAAVGLDRINLRPETSIELEWMLPAPAQGAIMIVCREEDTFLLVTCRQFNDAETALCAKTERDFLRALIGGCSTPIGALAEIKNDQIHFRGNILSLDGKEKVEIEKKATLSQANTLGKTVAEELLVNGGQAIVNGIRAKNNKP